MEEAMKRETKKNIVFVCIIGMLICIIFAGFLLRDSSGNETELSESNDASIKLVDSLKRQLTERDARIERNKRTIETLQANLKKSKEDIREFEKNREQLDAANRRLGEYEQRERDRKRERNRIIDELRKGIVDLKGDIEKIPTLVMD